MAKRKKAAKKPKPYHRNVWDKVKAKIEAGRPVRRRLEEARQLREVRHRRLVRVYVLLWLLHHGTKALPINRKGDVAVPLEIWGCWIVRLGRALRLIRSLPAPPRVAELQPEGGDGLDAGETILDVALRGNPREQVMAACADGLTNLRQLRTESVGDSDWDSPFGITRYFQLIARWFWSSEEFLKEGVVVAAIAHKEIDAINAGAGRPQLKIVGTPSAPVEARQQAGISAGTAALATATTPSAPSGAWSAWRRGGMPLRGWVQICRALAVTNERPRREQIGRLNDTTGGPIVWVGRTPEADSGELKAWIEDVKGRAEAAARSRDDRQMTVDELSDGHPKYLADQGLHHVERPNDQGSLPGQ